MPELIRGRAPFILTNLSAFTVGVNGNPPIRPYNREFAYDDLGDKSIGHIEFDANEEIGWKFVSTCQDINEYLTSLKNTGLFDNAVAGVMSKELTYFLYNNETRSVIFNNKIVYDDNFRYYAIRKGTEFITGADYNGTIVNICDMVRSETFSGSSVFVRKPSIGAILPNAAIIDGDSFIVEFFDANKKLIGRDVFYAEYMNTFTGSTSDTGISGLRIITTRPYPEGGANAASLFKGESVEQLAYSLILEYNNGDAKDVTHETNKITITGLNTINTSVLTGSTPHIVTFEYNPGEEVGVSVSVDLSVHVVTDITAEVAELLPVYYYSSTILSSIIRRYFATMSNGSFYEITSKIADDQPINHANLPNITNQRKTIETKFNLGLFDQTPQTFLYSIDAATELSVTRVRNFANAESTNDRYKRIGVSGENLSLWNNFIVSDVIRDGITPTQFRIKTIDNFIITGNIAVSSYSSFSKNANTANVIANKNCPVIVEFFTDATVITKAIVAYFN